MWFFFKIIIVIIIIPHIYQNQNQFCFGFFLQIVKIALIFLFNSFFSFQPDHKAPGFIEDFEAPLKVPFINVCYGEDARNDDFPIINPSKTPMWGPHQESKKSLSER